MSQLRQAMIDAVLVRGFAVRTHRSYLSAVEGLSKYYHCSPKRLSSDEVQRYFLYLVKERHLAPASCRLSLNGIRFLYQEVLQRAFEAKIQIPKRAQRITELLTRKEVGAILESCPNRKHKMLLTVCYGCGLRVSELLYLKVRDIDGERCLLRIEQGKGAKRKTGVNKVGGIHSLRHAYATHQLAAGMEITKLQHQLGHQDVRTTLRYVHWVPNYQGGASGTDLIAGLEVDHVHKN